MEARRHRRHMASHVYECLIFAIMLTPGQYGAFGSSDGRSWNLGRFVKDLRSFPTKRRKLNQPPMRSRPRTDTGARCP